MGDILKIRSSDWQRIGEKIIKIIKDMTQLEGVDVNEKPFAKYSKSYRNKKLGNKFSTQSRSSKPDLALTGDTMGDLTLKEKSSRGVTIGWTAYGHIIDGQADQGRAVSTDKKPVSDRVLKYMERQCIRVIEKNMSRASGNIVLKVGVK